MIGQPRPLGEHLQGLDPSTVCSVPALSGLSFRAQKMIICTATRCMHPQSL